MEDRKDNRVRRILGLTVVVSLAVMPAAANHHFTWPTDIAVQTNPDAVVVEAGVTGSVSAGGSSQHSGGSNCWIEGPGNIGVASEDIVRQDPNVLPYTLICDGRSVGVVWLPIVVGAGSAAPAPSPHEIAMQLRERIPVPNVIIEINPNRGLVGVDSWFWIEGYDGGPITESTDAFGSLVEVDARVQRYDWSFGDGERLLSDSPGRPYPEPSDVRHTYERSSLGHEKGYPVEVAFFFSVRYRVGGGGWIELPAIERVAQAVYPVRESQSVIRR